MAGVYNPETGRVTTSVGYHDALPVNPLTPADVSMGIWIGAFHSFEDNV